MIHMRTRASDYGAADVCAFVADVLPAAGDDPVQIAPSAGWGGIDANTLSALGTWADALQANSRLGRHLWLDLAEVWKPPPPPGTDNAALVALIRQIGPPHFVAASDWPFAGDLVAYHGRIFPDLPLSDAEWSIIRRNVARTSDLGVKIGLLPAGPRSDRSARLRRHSRRGAPAQGSRSRRA